MVIKTGVLLSHCLSLPDRFSAGKNVFMSENLIESNI